MALALGAAALGWSSTAEAKPPGPGAQDARFRFHGETDFLGFTHINPDGAGDSFNMVGFGFGRPTLIDSGPIFINARPTWSLGFGYVFHPVSAFSGNVGARFAFVVDGVGNDNPDDDVWTTLVGGNFVPYFRFIFLPGRTFRPYAEIRFGLGGSSRIVNDRDADAKVTTSSIYPAVGAAGGVHIFIIDAFSFDVGGSLDYYAPHGRTHVDPEPPGAPDPEWEKAADVLNIAIQAGFSVWFG